VFISLNRPSFGIDRSIMLKTFSSQYSSSPIAVIVAFLGCLVSTWASGDELRVFPEEIELNTKGDQQTFVVQLVDNQGITRDVTTTAGITVENPELLSIQDQTVRPLRDGNTFIRFDAGQQSVKVPVQVSQSDVVREISFNRDVMPIFMKHGCNNGSCHGAARGKDGFMLSLFGYDPVGDHFRLTQQIIGRRVDLAVPEKSLLLQKALGEVDHTGGQLFDADSLDYRTLLSWLEVGAPEDPPGTVKPTGIELLPRKIVFDGKGATQPTVVMATYSDGSVRDVTRLALFLTNNDSVTSVNADGIVSAVGRGGAFAFARFDKFTVGSEVIVLPTGDKFVWPQTPESNYIDGLVFDKLKKLHLEPSPLASDEEFLRRVYLDMIGMPPSVEDYHRFMSDNAPDKRAKLIDELLERDELVDMWSMKWGELLRIRAVGNQPQFGRDAKAMVPYASWVRKQMSENRPLNEFVAELVQGTGSNLRQPTANFYTSAEKMTAEKTAEDFAQVFLGTRIQCAQCHNHPFDQWTMDDYYGFASFFSGIGLRRGVEGREAIVFNNNAAKPVSHPVHGRPMPPKFLGGDLPEVQGKDPREALAQWLTSPENVAFRETMANIIWAHFFGRGIAEPFDDVRISNPPSNQELLAELGSRLADYRFDKKQLIRDICNSRTYQLSSATNETNELDEAFFSHSYVRRLQAEVLLDSISFITETSDRFQSSAPNTRASQLYGGNISNYFLTTFGRAPRETACSCEVSREANLSQALHMVNGDTITQKIAAGTFISQMIADEKTPSEIITELYVRALSRKPTDSEVKRLTEIVESELKNENRVEELITMRARADSSYSRAEERLKSLRNEVEEKQSEGQELDALKSLTNQIRSLEKQLVSVEQRYEKSIPQLIYGDILWGLFNSTEFAFNH
jgi:Protein of unknown function (DUF1549)/Protein of unknown function (DUF1553)